MKLARRTFLTGLGTLSVSNISGRALFAQTSTGRTDSTKDWAPIADLLRRILLENILPFWYPQTLDREHGGYLLNHDRSGKYQGGNPKRLVVQARTVWFFSHLFREGYGSKEHLDAARLGFEFLRDFLWDKQYGGFYWEVDERGTEATLPDKHLYGESFALYALSEYFLASGDPEALALARQLFGILEYIAHDSRFGGYLESFRRDWTAAPNGEASYMGAPHELKLMNTHLHLMEALTTYWIASKDSLAKDRLVELIFIQSNSVLRKNLGACTDRYNRDWSPLTDSSAERVSYGHDLENIWLLMDACDAVGIPNGTLMDFFESLSAYSYEYGMDRDQGGFFNSGAFNQPADQRGKEWWVQAEALVSALRMYRKTGKELYYSCFMKTLDWIDKKQIDWERGEWVASLSDAGMAGGDKAGPWKAPYHNGRAMMECLKLIRSFS